MERFYSLFQTCAAATYFSWLQLLEDPSTNQFNRIQTPPPEYYFFRVRKAR